MSKVILDAMYVSVWDGGSEVRTPCKVNLETREIFDIQTVDVDVDVLEREYVVVEGEEFEVEGGRFMSRPVELSDVICFIRQTIENIHILDGLTVCSECAAVFENELSDLIEAVKSLPTL